MIIISLYYRSDRYYYHYHYHYQYFRTFTDALLIVTVIIITLECSAVPVNEFTKSDCALVVLPGTSCPLQCFVVICNEYFGEIITVYLIITRKSLILY